MRTVQRESLDVFPISWDSESQTMKVEHTGVEDSDPSAFFLNPPFGGLSIIKT